MDKPWPTTLNIHKLRLIHAFDTTYFKKRISIIDRNRYKWYYLYILKIILSNYAFIAQMDRATAF